MEEKLERLLEVLIRWRPTGELGRTTASRLQRVNFYTIMASSGRQSLLFSFLFVNQLFLLVRNPENAGTGKSVTVSRFVDLKSKIPMRRALSTEHWAVSAEHWALSRLACVQLEHSGVKGENAALMHCLSRLCFGITARLVIRLCSTLRLKAILQIIQDKSCN